MPRAVLSAQVVYETGAARGNKIQASRDFSRVPPREQWLRTAGPPEMLRLSLRGVAQHFDVGGYRQTAGRARSGRGWANSLWFE